MGNFRHNERTSRRHRDNTVKSGDLVRFKSVTYPYSDDGKWRFGLLIEYKSWEKVATVLYSGKLIRIRAEQIQKAGRKDESRHVNRNKEK